MDKTKKLRDRKMPPNFFFLLFTGPKLSNPEKENLQKSPKKKNLSKSEFFLSILLLQQNKLYPLSFANWGY